MTGATARYAELQVTTNYSFLRGASHPEELFAAAALLGLPALGVVDRNSVAGIVRAWEAARATDVRLVAGCRVGLRCGTDLLLYPTDRPAWSRLCRLLTLGKGRAGKGGCDLGWDDLLTHGEGLLAVLLPDAPDAALTAMLDRLRDGFRTRAYLALTLRRRPGDAARLQRLTELARAARVATVATGDVLYHAPERRILQDVLTCIREGCTIDAAGFRRERFADRHLRSPEEMARLFARHPEAVERTLEITERCTFDLSELRYQYPDEAERPGEAPQAALERLTWAGVSSRYPDGLPDDVQRQLRHELGLIGQLQYAPYFLTVHSIVRYARSKDILCQGRGSAANSAVCYVLGITSIDPTRSGLLFERFVSLERHEPPDIDVDFEAERREEVIQWVFEHYGRERAALCCTVMRFRARGAVRDVGKVMGLPEDVTAALTGQVWGWSEEGVEERHAEDLNLNLDDRRLRLTLDLARELIGFPRQLGTHPGGFVLTQDRLDDLVPIEPAAMAGRAVVEWDKTLWVRVVPHSDSLQPGHNLGIREMMMEEAAQHDVVRSELGAIFVSMELSRSTWLITSLSPGAGEKMSRHTVRGGDVSGLLECLRLLKSKAQARTGINYPIIAIQEAGLDGFWIHRVLEGEGFESHVVDAASIATSRRHRRVKTDRVDGETLVRTLLAFKRREPRVCTMIRAPSPVEEDRRRIARERRVLTAERVQHVNRIKGLLFSQGIAFDPLHRNRRERLEELQTGDGRPLPGHMKSQIARELDRIDLLLVQIKAVEAERDALLEERPSSAASSPGMLARITGIGSEFAAVVWTEGLFRHFDNRRQVAAYAGLAPTPWQSGSVDREQGVGKSGNPRLRATMLQMAWLWLRHQPDSALSRWFHGRVAQNGGRVRKTMITALARKLLVALWRYVTSGVLIEGAAMKAA